MDTFKLFQKTNGDFNFTAMCGGKYLITDIDGMVCIVKSFLLYQYTHSCTAIFFLN